MEINCKKIVTPQENCKENLARKALTHGNPHPCEGPCEQHDGLLLPRIMFVLTPSC